MTDVLHTWDQRTGATKVLLMHEFRLIWDELDAELYHTVCGQTINLNDARDMADIWRLAHRHECPDG